MLAAEGLCVDLRVHGGPVYVDATRFGLPLRQIMSADGRPNYLACALRDLVPLAPKHDETVLLYDRELEPDYLLLHRVLAQLGATVWRVPIGRVPIDGRITSARHGGWHDHAAAALLDAAGGFDDAALRLGMRLYFIAMLGPGSTDSFRHELLHRWLNRAGRLLAGISGRGRAPAEVVAAHRGEHAYVDPYRLTASLLNRHREQPGSDLLREVFHAEPGSVAGPGDPPDRRGAPGADRPVHHR